MVHVETFASDTVVISPAPKTTVTVSLSLQAHAGIWPKVATVFPSSKMSTLHADPKQAPPSHQSPDDERQTAAARIASIRDFSIVPFRAGMRLLRLGLHQNSEELWIRRFRPRRLAQ